MLRWRTGKTPLAGPRWGRNIRLAPTRMPRPFFLIKDLKNKKHKTTTTKTILRMLRWTTGKTPLAGPRWGRKIRLAPTRMPRSLF